MIHEQSSEKESRLLIFRQEDPTLRGTALIIEVNSGGPDNAENH